VNCGEGGKGYSDSKEELGEVGVVHSEGLGKNSIWRACDDMKMCGKNWGA
jgi:hypothetical protein